ncbi:MAG: sigma 54-interacting transcriptional regulator, partial [Melioribacteraceae bacterium]|nr:sigma 54-interacting transcriptional regulator [Melioribacteraceae bacterium]
MNKENMQNFKEEYSEALEEHLRFEELLGLLSSKLVNLPFEAIDNEIVESMKLLAEFFHADRCHVGKLDTKESKIVVSHYYADPNVTIPQVMSIGNNSFSYIFNSINNGESVVFSLPEELPHEAAEDREAFIKSGIKSLLVIPLFVDNKVLYGLSLSTISKQRKWSEHTITHVKIVGNIIANVLNRKIILEETAKEKLWADSILQGMPQLAYVFDAEGKLKRWNEKFEKILGYKSKELENKFVLDFISEEYREETMNKFIKIIQSGKEDYTEYELLTKSGEKIYHRGNGNLTIIDGEEYLIGMAIDISKLIDSQGMVKKQLEEIGGLKSQLEVENIYLKHELKKSHNFGEIIGEHETLKHTLNRVHQVAPMDTTVLLEGETGTGKELFARAIHSLSDRNKKSLVTVNCASIPSNLFESELFGHEKGSFTGAISKQIGKFELADGGTLFLDEIGELPYNVQAKLLRVLQEGVLERIGGKKSMKVDVRVITATNRVLEEEVKNKMFRADLYYRLNVYPISIAPLRERVSDIPLLVEHFVDKYNKKFGKNIKSIPKKTILQLKQYSWPGNIRELENII